MVIAYEPVWAIGTGQAATPEDAQEACRWIREVVAGAPTPRPPSRIRIQYGGSVNEENTESLLQLPRCRRRPGRRGQPGRRRLRRHHPGRGTVRAVSLVASPSVSRQRRKIAC